MTLVHFSAKPLTKVYSTFGQQKIDNKPVGLWVSDEANPSTGWAEWCRNNEVRVECLAVATEVKLARDHRCLIIGSPEELDQFALRFGCNSARWRAGGKIDWRQVAQQYQGIIITPYLWARHWAEHCFWYYGWDCASGCIWDADAIAETRLYAEGLLATEATREVLQA